MCPEKLDFAAAGLAVGQLACHVCHCNQIGAGGFGAMLIMPRTIMHDQQQ
jgi:hypothetical protein